MALPATSISMTTHSDEPLRQAVRNVYAAMRADFGVQFSKQFDKVSDPDAISENFWMRRLHQRISGCEPADVVDGYDRCIADRRPYMPTLVEIATMILAVHGERLRADEQIAQAEAPKVSGLAGYVEHLSRQNPGDWAQRHIALMREILARPEPQNEAERNARLNASIAEHEKLMAKAPPIRHRGERHRCAVPGCVKAGNLTHSLGGQNATWFCHEHWRRA